MESTKFLTNFLITLVVLVAAFFIIIAVLGTLNGKSTADMLRAIGDATIFTKEFWSGSGVIK